MIEFESLACYNFYTREIAWYPPSNFDQTSYLMEAYRTKVPCVRERTRKLLEQLREWAGQKHGRQQEVADAVGVHKSVVSNWLAFRQELTGEQALALQEFLTPMLNLIFRAPKLGTPTPHSRGQPAT